jgi:hypothetical protein
VRGGDAEHRRLALSGGLLAAAKRANKIDAGYRFPTVPAQHAGAARERSRAAERGLFSEYPFGTDLTREEIDLARALRWLKEKHGGTRARAETMARALLVGRREERALSRAAATRGPQDFTTRSTRKLVRLALRATADSPRQATSQTDAKDP